MTFAQNDKSICFKCGKQGHDFKNCLPDKEKKLLKPDWWINKPGNKQKFDNHVEKVQFTSKEDTKIEDKNNKDPH